MALPYCSSMSLELHLASQRNRLHEMLSMQLKKHLATEREKTQREALGPCILFPDVEIHSRVVLCDVSVIPIELLLIEVNIVFSDLVIV